LEGRQLLATFSVTNLNPAGPGSLAWAIVQSNVTPGADTIDFDVAGTIRTGRASLPVVTDRVTIDGASAPGFAGAPRVTVDFQGSAGLRFGVGGDASTLRSLSVVGAGTAGVMLDASFVTLEGNYIGLRADGLTPAGNRGDGVQINPWSHNNLIGHADPVTGVSYYNASSVGMQPVSGWQGIRESETPGQYLITGTSNSNGLLYVGPLSGSGGTSYSVNFPGATATSVYGPDAVGNGVVRLVGTYRTGDSVVRGFAFQGTTDQLSQAGNYRTIAYPGAQFTYVHSTMGDLAVGNADGPEGNLPVGTGHAFIYDLKTDTFLADVVYPGSTSTTAYGVWDNGLGRYTICGGYTTPGSGGKTLASGYLVDFDAKTGQFSNWTSFDYPNGPAGQDFATHIQGLSSVEKGVYTLAADSVQSGSTNPAQGSWVSVRRNTDGTFGPAAWVDLNYPGVDPSQALTSNNSVAGNAVVGIVMGKSGVFSFQANVNVGFQLSNVISANGGNGVGVYGSYGNQVAMNYIGTDAGGTLGRGNAKNGVLLTNGSAFNLIGGQSTGGNDPTAGVFARPPAGNLISGNGANGVLINNGATANTLSGNFVGTSASGNSPLGNRLDGVAIENADGNQLIGCTFRQDPFVFYNVLSGNGGNGLRITNSNNTTVHANFMGVGADNATVVPNGGDGLLVSGASRNTQVGGVIPLGNVISGNAQNGIEVRDQASGFVSFNTFAGVFAFGGAAPNRRNGILITSTGGNNLIRTSIVSGNLGNGIEIGGYATGVQVTETAAGTNTGIQYPISNGGSGVKISGHAHGNAIGGFQPSIEPQTTLSGNFRYGVEITDSAHDNAIFHTYIGTNFNATGLLGNFLGGVYLGPGTWGTTVGGSSAAYLNKIVFNYGPGVTIASSSTNSLAGNEIAYNAGDGVAASDGQFNAIGFNTISSNGGNGVSIAGRSDGTQVVSNTVLANGSDGVFLSKAPRVTIGGAYPGAGNRLISNLGFGLRAVGVCTGTLVQGNAFVSNTKGDVDLSGSTGITVLP